MTTAMKGLEMTTAPYELVPEPGGVAGAGSTSGVALFSRHRRSTAGPRSPLTSGRRLGLDGLLPTGVTTLEGQLRRVYAQYREQANPFGSGCTWRIFATATRCCSTGCSTEHISEMLPVVYTPTVGLAIERFSQEFRRTRGVYLSVDHPEDVETALRNTGLGPDDVDLLVATDSEGILGIGDQGVGGIEISIGKLAVYTAAAGIHPRRVLPVVLDMGTDNLKLLNDEMYLGARHARVRDQRYDDLIDAYVTAVSKLFPNAMLHWEDFGAHQRPPHPEQVRRSGLHVQRRHAGHRRDRAGRRVLARCAPPGSRIRDQRVVIYGAGTAGLGHRRHDARADDPRRPITAARRPAASTRWAARGCCSTTHRTCWTSSSPTPGPATRSPAGPARRRDDRPRRGGCAGASRRC